MEELRETFLSESISKLNNLRIALSDETAAPEFRRELFRSLHTIKGTSQTFGLSASATLAHTLENLLAAAGKNNSIQPEELKPLLIEGIEVLSQSLTEKNFRIPDSFAEKFKEFEAEPPQNQPTDYASEIPESIAAQLSSQEKAVLKAAMENGNDLAILEIGFDAANFADEFKAFREKLSATGEVVAALPSAKFAAQGKIGFQIIYATFEDITDIMENYPVEVVEQIYQTFSNNLPGILHQIAGHGKSLAARLGKQVQFEISSKLKDVSAQTLKIIFDILLHLIRNAIDHGIERQGKIKIELVSNAGEGVFLKVSDDGRGIDLEKVRRSAIEKNLISGDADLSEPEILNLLFAHGFSTAENVSEISGRGVGLDVVKDLTEKAGGSISIKSQSGKGTTFEILLKEI